MSDCCPRRAVFTAPPPSRAPRPAPRPRLRAHSRFGRVRAALAACCLRMIGWYRLERLLASIPDSNDDFGIA
ncbi:hypothetical protein F7R21_21690 [Burkholderia latens]|uniref:Uncharacterized protein n=1 Tax=Burkholderia latens TaxID=488446 RepID=A0A6H9SY87_9BURK|nr:hypothetical protein F7R21_21690 [Burkholderia latens]VWB30429.1 hypothetical protein BLA24064_01283 [Burkholderia latens]